jgi:hypothetical protein
LSRDSRERRQHRNNSESGLLEQGGVQIFEELGKQAVKNGIGIDLELGEMQSKAKQSAAIAWIAFAPIGSLSSLSNAFSSASKM